jgi:hypothetical protein
MRQVLCVASAALMVLCISKPAVSQVIAGAGELGATGGTTQIVAGATDPRDGALLPTHRAVRAMTMCATAALLERYAFANKYPEGAACEQLEPNALLQWSGQRESTLWKGSCPLHDSRLTAE